MTKRNNRGLKKELAKLAAGTAKPGEITDLIRRTKAGDKAARKRLVGLLASMPKRAARAAEIVTAMKAFADLDPPDDGKSQ
jgi:hypothetical protein